MWPFVLALGVIGAQSVFDGIKNRDRDVFVRNYIDHQQKVAVAEAAERALKAEWEAHPPQSTREARAMEYIRRAEEKLDEFNQILAASKQILAEGGR
jgi:hypothetical protein